MPPSSLPPSSSPSPSSRLLLIGWDGADWEFLHPMMDRGEMPTLNALVDAGAMGNLATLAPCLSPLLWTSIATGQTADRHGILGFIEPTPDGAGVRRVSSTSRRCQALWNIAARNGLRSIVVGWHASQPAEEIEGVCVSEAFFDTPTQPVDAAWPVARGSVWPPDLATPLGELRLHPAELSGRDLLPLIPDLASIDVGKDLRPFRLAEILARDISTQAVATASLENEPWQFAAVFFPGLDTAGHYFMPFHPPKMANVPEREFELYRGVMSGLHQLYDQMLAALIRQAGDDACVMIVSDHGFQSGGRRPAWVNSDRGLDVHAADWHRSFGVFALKGPGILADERVYGATLLDVAPTVLALLGLPANRSMPGRALAEAFPDRDIIKRIDRIESSSPSPEHDSPRSADQDQTPHDSLVLERLAELGYLPAPSSGAAETGTKTGAASEAVRLAIRESQFNLATVLLHHGQPRKALAVLRPLREAATTDDPRALLAMARCHHQLDEHQQCVDGLTGWPHPLGADAKSVEARLIRASSLHALGRTADAKEELEYARTLAPANVEVWRMLGEHAIAVAAWTTAERAFQRALEIDSDHPGSRHGLGVCALKRKAFDEALKHCRAAIGAQYFFPAAHYHLAFAALRLGDPEGALNSLRTAIRQAPRFEKAYELAIDIERSQGRLVEVVVLRQELERARAFVSKQPISNG